MIGVADVSCMKYVLVVEECIHCDLDVWMLLGLTKLNLKN